MLVVNITVRRANQRVQRTPLRGAPTPTPEAGAPFSLFGPHSLDGLGRTATRR